MKSWSTAPTGIGALWAKGRAGVAAAALALLVAACGGSDPYEPGSEGPSGAPTEAPAGGFTSLVSFGDSLSDLGTYTPATVIPGTDPPVYLGGKWTTNTTPQSATIWVEHLAASLNLMVTPAEVGFAGQSVACPITLTFPSLASTCTGYAQGGARVTNPAGTGSSIGALTVPVKTQIERHLASFGTFKESDLVMIWAGGNDLLEQFAVFGAAAVEIRTQQALGNLTANEANALLLNAQLLALGEMKAAALDLSKYVRDDILGRGGRYVAIVNLSDPVDTPFGAAFAADPQTAALAPVLTALAENFNLWLREGLRNQPVRIIDAVQLAKDISADPAAYGIENVTGTTCDKDRQALVLGRDEPLTYGVALFCNVTPGADFNMLTAGANPATWFYSDDVHPSTGGHRVLAQEFAKQLRSFGWIQ